MAQRPGVATETGTGHADKRAGDRNATLADEQHHAENTLQVKRGIFPGLFEPALGLWLGSGGRQNFSNFRMNNGLSVSRLVVKAEQAHRPDDR